MVKKRTVPGKKGKEPSSSRKAARHRRSSYTLAIKQEVIGRVEEYEVLLDSLNNHFHILALSENWIKVDNVDNVSFYSYEHIYNVRPVSDNNEDKDT